MPTYRSGFGIREASDPVTRLVKLSQICRLAVVDLSTPEGGAIILLGPELIRGEMFSGFFQHQVAQAGQNFA